MVFFFIENCRLRYCNPFVLSHTGWKMHGSCIQHSIPTCELGHQQVFTDRAGSPLPKHFPTLSEPVPVNAWLLACRTICTSLRGRDPNSPVFLCSGKADRQPEAATPWCGQTHWSLKRKRDSWGWFHTDTCWDFPHIQVGSSWMTSYCIISQWVHDPDRRGAVPIKSSRVRSLLSFLKKENGQKNG